MSITTPAAHLAGLPDARRPMVDAIREVINHNVPEGLEEGIHYGMLSWGVPHSIYPDGYHCSPDLPVPYVSLANQKGNVSLYLFCLYVDEDLPTWFAEQVKARGMRLDMGKSCVRFKRMEHIPLDLIGETLQRMPLDRFLARYTASIPASKRKKSKS